MEMMPMGLLGTTPPGANILDGSNLIMTPLAEAAADEDNSETETDNEDIDVVTTTSNDDDDGGKVDPVHFRIEPGLDN